MSFSTGQNSFTGGEWAPDMHSRSDLVKYQTALQTMENMLPSPKGGAFNRPGTRYVGPVKLPESEGTEYPRESRIIPFVFSIEQAYALVFTDIGTPSPDGRMFVILDGAFLSVDIAVPYTDDEMSLLKYAQRDDVMYLTHPNHPPQKLTRTSHTAWTITPVVFGASLAAPTGFARSAGAGTGKVYAVTAVPASGGESVISTSAVGGQGDTFTWNVVSGADRYAFYENKNGVYGYLGIATTNTFTTEADVDPDMLDTPPQARDPLGSSGNYPRACAFYEQRLVYSGTDNYPQDVWGSVTGDYDNMNVSLPLKPSDAYNFTLDSNQVNTINWIVPLNTLVLGTSGSEWVMSGGASGVAITNSTVEAKQQSQWGSSVLPPLVVGNRVLFLERSGTALRDIEYSREAGAYVGADRAILASHLLERHEVVDWCYQRSPNSTIWAVRDDGALLGLTYYNEHEVWAWSRHTTDGKVKSIASVPNIDGTDTVYMAIRRTILGDVIDFVESLAERIATSENDRTGEPDVRNSFFVDSGLSLDAPQSLETIFFDQFETIVVVTGHGLINDDIIDIAGVPLLLDGEEYPGLNTRYVVGTTQTDSFKLLDVITGLSVIFENYGNLVSDPGGSVRQAVLSVSGLTHLEGEEVAVLADGNVVYGKVVDSGGITLDLEASRVHVGLPFVSRLHTFGSVLQTDAGTTQDKITDVKEVQVQLDNTRALMVGPSEDRLVDVPFRTTEAYGVPTSLFTGKKNVSIYSGDGEDGSIFVKNVEPLPITVLSIIAGLDHGES